MITDNIKFDCEGKYYEKVREAMQELPVETFDFGNKGGNKGTAVGEIPKRLKVTYSIMGGLVRITFQESRGLIGVKLPDESSDNYLNLDERLLRFNYKGHVYGVDLGDFIGKSSD